MPVCTDLPKATLRHASQLGGGHGLSSGDQAPENAKSSAQDDARLAGQELMHFTSDIAPIACIQKQLVRNMLKHWRRQVSPMELLRRAKVHGVPAIEPGRNLNEERLAQYLAAYTFISVPGPAGQNERIRHSKYLGRQIVDLAVDAKDPDRLFVDRMSSVGKAMVAVLTHPRSTEQRGVPNPSA